MNPTPSLLSLRLLWPTSSTLRSSCFFSNDRLNRFLGLIANGNGSLVAHLNHNPCGRDVPTHQGVVGASTAANASRSKMAT